MTANIHVVMFDDFYGAENMLENVNLWADKGWLNVEDAVVVTRGSGAESATLPVATANAEQPLIVTTGQGAESSRELEIRQTTQRGGKFALGGGGIGLLAGMLVGGPIGGLLLGATAGAIAGAMRDSGIDDKFIQEVGTGLQPGTSALFLMTSGGDEQKILEELRPHKARLLKTTLSPERERALRNALSKRE